jgi:hypothetical protein
VKIEALGAVLIDNEYPFRTNGEQIILDEKKGDFSLKGLVYVKSLDPAQICGRVEVRGPFGYKDDKEVCS